MASRGQSWELLLREDQRATWSVDIQYIPQIAGPTTPPSIVFLCPVGHFRSAALPNMSTCGALSLSSPSTVVMVSISSSTASARMCDGRCSLQIHMKHRDASCCERDVYHISISLNGAFVFELWIGFHLVPPLKILRKCLLYFGILEKQDSF